MLLMNGPVTNAKQLQAECFSKEDLAKKITITKKYINNKNNNFSNDFKNLLNGKEWKFLQQNLGKPFAKK